MKARVEASRLLSRILREDAYANRVLDASLSHFNGDPRDRSLLTELVYGVLRHLLFVDHVLDQHARQGVDSIDPLTLDHLRVAAYQLLFLPRIPSHAAVDEAVQAVRKLRGPVMAGFANGVLRKIASARAERHLPDPLTDLAEHLSVSESHPVWLVERYLRDLGAERTQKRLALHNVAPTLSLRVNPGWGERARLQSLLEEEGIQVQPTVFSPHGLRLEAPNGPAVMGLLHRHPEAFVIQDEAAQIVSLWLAGEGEEGVKRILDACAAPGGKTAHLAALFPQAELTALDLHPQKLELIRSTCKRLGFSNVRVQQADVTDVKTIPAGPYDRILCDAPCSGLGVLRKHPEIRYRATPTKIAQLAELQAKMLDTLAPLVSVGGLLVYSLCTDTEEEGPLQIQAFLERHPHFSLDAGASPPLFLRRLLGESRFLKTSPELHGMDAFFAARLRRLS